MPSLQSSNALHKSRLSQRALSAYRQQKASWTSWRLIQSWWFDAWQPAAPCRQPRALHSAGQEPSERVQFQGLTTARPGATRVSSAQPSRRVALALRGPTREPLPSNLHAIVGSKSSPAAGGRSRSSMPHVCVLGAGFVGLATAVRLQEEATVDVTVVAKAFDQDTTSNGAGETPPELVLRWGTETFQHLLQIHFSPEAGSAGTALTSSYQLWDRPAPDPIWKDVVPHFRHLSQTELAMFGGQQQWAHGWGFTTVICDSPRYLRHLMARFKKAGGRVQQTDITSLDELAHFDAVVNCAGLGSLKLFSSDKKMVPVRGQVIRVRAPWVKHYMNANMENYIIPNTDSVVLGGTTQKGNWDTTVSQEDKQRILEGCCRILPSLRNAEIISDWAGLRPYREPLRIELEQVSLKGGSQRLPIVHNYGHGGSGLTLGWGTAGDAIALVKQALQSGPDARL